MKKQLLFILLLGIPLQADVITTVFDKLFPQKSLETIFKTCAQLQYELDCFSDQQNLSEDDKELFVDIVVGKLFNLSCLIKSLLEKKVSVFAPDIIYMKKLFEKIRATYQSISACGMPKKEAHTILLMRSIAEEVEKLVQCSSEDMAFLFMPCFSVPSVCWRVHRT